MLLAENINTTFVFPLQPLSTTYPRPRLRAHAPRPRTAFIDPTSRIRAYFHQPVIAHSVSSTNIAPPRQYTPVIQAPNPLLTQDEPTVPLQSFTNGVQSVQPLRQVLSGPSNQPVYVITRQVKTPTGQVFHQRFTQPVQPPPKYLQVVRRITTTPDGSSRPAVVVAPTSVPPPPAPNSPPPQIPGQSPTPSTATQPTVNPVQPGRKIIKVIRSTVPNAIRILPPKSPPP